MRTTIRDIQQMRDRGERIPMVTAYDYTSAQIADRAGIPMILVGDSLGMVVLGHEIDRAGDTRRDAAPYARGRAGGAQGADRG